MNKLNPRFWATVGNEHREIVSVTRNEYGDIILALDGGEVWRFTPRNPKIETPPPERIAVAGRMRDSRTGAETSLAVVVLKDPKETIHGNLKVIPAPVAAANTAPPTEPPTLTTASLYDLSERCSKELPYRKKPSHWDVFIAAWKDGMNPYEMERRRHWKRRTCASRLKEIESKLLNGNKISSLKFDDSVFEEYERMVEAGREHGVRLRPHVLLEDDDDLQEKY